MKVKTKGQKIAEKVRKETNNADRAERDRLLILALSVFNRRYRSRQREERE